MLLALKRMSILRVGEIVELVGLDFLERDQFFLNPYSENNEKIPAFLFDGRKLRKLCR